MSLTIEMFAGSVLGAMDDLLRATPGLLVLVPALLLLRGNINASLGSRLTSAVHLGLVPGDVPRDDPEVRVNVRASYLLGSTMGIVAGVLAHVVTVAFGDASAGIVTLAAIGGLVAAISGLPMIPITLQSVRISFRRGLDPDNVIAPALLTIGDLTTILLLFLIAGTWRALYVGGGFA